MGHLLRGYRVIGIHAPAVSTFVAALAELSLKRFPSNSNDIIDYSEVNM